MDNSKIKIFKNKISILVNHYNNGNLDKVITDAKILLKKYPNNPFIYNLIGSCYQEKGLYDEAKKNFEKSLLCDPGNISAYNNLANTLKYMLKFNEAENIYKKIISENPNFLKGIVNYANFKSELNQSKEAIDLYKLVLDKEPNSPIVNYNLALNYENLGDFDNAKKYFKKMLILDPSLTIADRHLSRIIKYKHDDEHLKNMLIKITNHELENKKKPDLYFALSKAFEDTKDFEKSYEYMKKANQIKNEIIKFNIQKTFDLFSNLKKVFSEDLEKISLEKNEKKPIFIIGLPRSGTSLVEQIIASHSKVYGAGELTFLDKIIKENFFNENSILFNNLENFEILNKAQRKYIELVKNFDFTEDVFTDKNPFNFIWIGFILTIFPNSRIILCQRNFKDNFLSIFKNIFDGRELNWSYDENNIVDYFKIYKSLINFWFKKYPGKIYTIKYENLIENTESEIKKILNYCELNFEENCLNYYKSKKTIKTVSAAQARKPIYKDSVNSSDKFDKYFKIYFDKLNAV